MNITFLMDAPEKATIGALDPGLPAAESVDQVRVSCNGVRAFKHI